MRFPLVLQRVRKHWASSGRLLFLPVSSTLLELMACNGGVMRGVKGHTSRATRHTSHHTLRVTQHATHVTGQMQHVTRHTSSHVTRHTSHVTRHSQTLHIITRHLHCGRELYVEFNHGIVHAAIALFAFLSAAASGRSRARLGLVSANCFFSTNPENEMIN